MNFIMLFFCLSIFISSILLLTTSNRIYSILYLIYIYVSTALLIMYSGLVLVGLFYFLVYIGAVAILFLFSVMILDLKELVQERNYVDFISFGLIILFFAAAFNTIGLSSLVGFYNGVFEYFMPIDVALKSLGLLIFEVYNLSFLFTGIILLVSLIGAIHVTNKKFGFFIRKQSNLLFRNSYLLNVVIY